MGLNFLQFIFPIEANERILFPLLAVPDEKSEILAHDRDDNNPKEEEKYDVNDDDIEEIPDTSAEQRVQESAQKWFPRYLYIHWIPLLICLPVPAYEWDS